MMYVHLLENADELESNVHDTELTERHGFSS